MAEFPEPAFLPTVPVLIGRFTTAFDQSEADLGHGGRITFAVFPRNLRQSPSR